MTPHQFAELAAAIARHADELSSGVGPDAASLHRVWKRASRAIRGWREELFINATPHLYAEFFAAELSLRVWCTAVAASGRSRSDDAGPRFAARIFSDLLDLRCGMLQALAADHGLTAAEAAAVDRFRRRCERWADVLLGPLARRTGKSDFTLRPERAAEFAHYAAADPDGDASWPLVMAGLRLSFAAAEEFRGAETRPSSTAGANLAAALFASFPAGAFMAEGRLRSPAISRATRIVAEGPPQPARKSSRPVLPHTALHPPSEKPRPPHPISFAARRKRRPAG